jgi:hypothetical protein
VVEVVVVEGSLSGSEGAGEVVGGVCAVAGGGYEVAAVLAGGATWVAGPTATERTTGTGVVVVVVAAVVAGAETGAVFAGAAAASAAERGTGAVVAAGPTGCTPATRCGWVFGPTDTVA